MKCSGRKKKCCVKFFCVYLVYLFQAIWMEFFVAKKRKIPSTYFCPMGNAHICNVRNVMHLLIIFLSHRIKNKPYKAAAYNFIEAFACKFQPVGFSFETQFLISILPSFDYT